MALRMTVYVLSVVALFLEEPTEEQYGLDIAGALGLKGGTLYPILGRLERAGWLESRLEDADPRDLGRARRRLYRLTGVGELAAREAVNEHLRQLARGTRHPTSRPIPRVVRT